MNDTDLLSCLPPPIRGIKEYQAIMAAEQPYMDEIFSAIFSAPLEKSVQTASEIGISIWEHFLGIVPLATDTLEDRRFRVSSIMYDDSEMNYKAIIKKLTSLCGEGNFETDYRPDEYYFGVRIALRSQNSKSQAFAILDRGVPANFVLFVDLLYIKYAQLQKMTYGEVGSYTFKQLREDIELMERLGG